MIISIIGQPHSGKTTLARRMRDYIESMGKYSVGWLDGDDLRKISGNKDYSIDGRKLNIKLANDIAKIMNLNVDFMIMSLVSPFLQLREQLKTDGSLIVKEIYLHSNRQREGKMVSYYELPTENYLDIDTDTNGILQSLQLIKSYVQI